MSFDQMRGDYPDRFARFVGGRGFERLKHQGAWFAQCLFDHASTLTSPGHAALLTGCYPWKTGITANDICVRSTGQCNESIFDATFRRSPAMLRVPTLGDAMRAKDRRSKVMSIAFKDRAAILMAGHDPSHVLWFDTDSLAFTTSAYYQRPPWLGTLNTHVRASEYEGRVWRAGIGEALHPAYDDIEDEGALSSGQHVFPYRIPRIADSETFAADFLSSPFSLTFLFDAATEIVRREQLGNDTIPDLFTIGVSTTDILGHQFGPDSREVQEMYVACDTTLARFIDMLDERVGREHYVLVVTSDHGVGSIPELLARQGEPQGVSVDAGRLRAVEVKHVVDSALTSAFGQPTGPSWVTSFFPPSLFLDTLQLEQRNIDVAQASYVAAAALRAMHGILYTVTRTDLLAQRCTPDVPRDICRYIMQSFDAERSGDILIYPRPFWIFGSNVATHGTPYEYDRHVPLAFFGLGITGGRIETQVAPVDIAPTLAKLLGVDMDDVDGSALRLLISE